MEKDGEGFRVVLSKAEDLASSLEALEIEHEEVFGHLLYDASVSEALKFDLLRSKEEMRRLRDEFLMRMELYDLHMEANMHRKIIGYDPESFEPIYEESRETGPNLENPKE